SETILRWLNEYIALGHFKLDGRGSGCREWILSEDDLLHKLLTHLKTENRLTVSKAVEYINNTRLTSEGTSMSEARMKDVYGIVKPVSRGLVHSWLRRADCKFDRATQSYYTDGHNEEEVIASRLVYLAILRRLSLRQPVWMQIPLADLSEETLEAIEHDGMPSKVYKYVHEGRDFVEFHVERLGREGEAEGKGNPNDNGAFDEGRLKSKYGGNSSVRFQADAAWHMGQDGCIFTAYLREGMEWVIAKVRGIRKKTEGPGIMVSVFQDEIRGFGFAITGEELARVNVFRRVQGRKALQETPGIRNLDYGKQKDGYWNYDTFAEQCVDIMDCFEVLCPDWQLVMKVDHSSGHAKYREDGLHVGNTNLKWGGAKGGKMRNTTVTAACLGPNKAEVEWGGKPKGVRQMLWERGLWKDGMTGKAEVSSGLNAFAVLGNCPDFREEKSALQVVVESRGHALVMSSKCHPEYSWGKSQLEFRRKINDEDPSHLEQNMRKALNTEQVLTLERVRRFARRTRDYRRTYAL
ncbi:unnamed protein product, partial [Hapterophycus canaliculatus]